MIWLGLCLYWVTPWLITSKNIQAPGWYLALCISIYAFGVFTHFASDMQKTTALQLRPAELITTGMFARLRNPNYFGELLIYSGFGLLAMHWLPVVDLADLGWVYLDPAYVPQRAGAGAITGLRPIQSPQQAVYPIRVLATDERLLALLIQAVFYYG